MRDKRRSFWEVHAWMLHHDNAPAYTALNIHQFLAERNIATLEHPHIPLIWPSVTFPLLQDQSCFEKNLFFDINSIKIATTMQLKKIPENAFQECIESWKKRMHKCFKVEEYYFERI